MKKFIVFMLITLLFVSTAGGITAYAETKETEGGVSEKAASAYLIDYNTGTVLYERNAEAKLPIASMVKIMTLVITFDNIEKGNLTLDQKITVSETAAGMGGSQMFLDAHKDYSVSDLIKGIVVCSANDASVAIAETISGSKEDFIALMNETAKKMGMVNTVFVNVTGLPESGQHSTAKDVTIMMKKLLSYPEYFNYSKIYLENYTHPDGRVTELVNTNKLVRFYKGCDAGKTGFTNDAMFCLSASAVRNGMRVVATVIHSPDSKSRFMEVSSLFNYAFANYRQEKAVDAGVYLDKKAEVRRGRKDTLMLKAKESVYTLQKKGEKPEFTVSYDMPAYVTAPVKKGDTIGVITVTDASGKIIGKTDIIAAYDVGKMRYKDSLREILENWFF